MIGFLVFYCCFSALFCMSTVDETDYETVRGALMANIFFFILGPIMLPVILGITIGKIYKKYRHEQRISKNIDISPRQLH